MDFGRRKTHKFTFRSPKLDDLKKLAKLVTNTESFRAKFGELLALLKLNMIEGVLSTLVQFYDPVLFHISRLSAVANIGGILSVNRSPY